MSWQDIKATALIYVAIGVVVNAKGELLIARRPAHKFQGDLWEFPGGKVDAGESTEDGLIRELQEEVNLTPLSFFSLLQVRHDYNEKAFLLEAFLVKEFSGMMQAKEQQMLKWVLPSEIKSYDFPEANHIIIEKLLATIE